LTLLQGVLFAQLIDDLRGRRHDDFLYVGIFAVAMQIVDVPIASLRVLRVFLDSRGTPPGRICIGPERVCYDLKQFLLSFKLTRRGLGLGGAARGECGDNIESFC